MAIEGPSKAEINCVDNKDGTCSVSYLPTLPGDYNVIVKYNEDHIPGSPFTARITGGAPACLRVSAFVSQVLNASSVIQRTTSGALRSRWARRQILPWTLARRI